MSIDRTQDQPTQQGTVAEQPSSGMSFPTRADFSVEPELSDETLEAVAGGGTTPNPMPAAADPS